MGEREVIEAVATQEGELWVASFVIDGLEYGTQARTLVGLEPMIADVARSLGYDDVEVLIRQG